MKISFCKYTVHHKKCTRTCTFYDATTQICCIFAKEDVINILIAEYDYATDIAVQRAEERKIAYTEGKSLGLAEGRVETARRMKQENYEILLIEKITGLSKEEIDNL